MSAETRPQVFLTLDEVDELNAKLSSAYALSDLLNSSYHGSCDGPESESMAWISGMVFEALSDVKDLWKKGMKREQEAPQEPA